jgi:aspartyl protease family protein
VTPSRLAPEGYRRLRRGWLAASMIMLAGAGHQACAVDDILVMGLFEGKAVVVIDGKRRVLSNGETSPEGVTLIRANPDEAVLEIGGRQAVYSLGSRVHSNFAPREAPSVTVPRGADGLYAVSGSINGHSTRFLVDTGASAVALSETDARRMRLDYKRTGERVRVETASGPTIAYRVRLARVTVGGVMQRNVEAYVMPGNEPERILLGMSFLNRFKIRNDGRVLYLELKY